MKNYDVVKLIGYCGYCHHIIYSDDDYIHEYDMFYHKYCDNQMNTYIDKFGENHRYGE